MMSCPLPATGQTTCWDSNGNVIGCAGTGQDGDMLKGGPLAYRDNGDGTITDTNTGLVWEKQSNGDGSIHDINNTYTWSNAFAGHVAGLNTANFAGHNDWRVPNYRELTNIVNLQNFSPAVSPAFNTGCTVLTCSCTILAGYWSSSTFASSPGFAWFVNFNDGSAHAGSKGSNAYVRAVRGGS